MDVPLGGQEIPLRRWDFSPPQVPAHPAPSSSLPLCTRPTRFLTRRASSIAPLPPTDLHRHLMSNFHRKLARRGTAVHHATCGISHTVLSSSSSIMRRATPEKHAASLLVLSFLSPSARGMDRPHQRQSFRYQVPARIPLFLPTRSLDSDIHSWISRGGI